MKQYRFMGISLAAMVILAGCVDPSNMTEPERETLRGKHNLSGSTGAGPDNFGNTISANMATHIIDPAPAYAEDPPRVDGQIILSGYGRYRTGKVKSPESVGVIDR